jgi:starch-binding outer membrane protein, SusD/RagB family
MKKYIFKLSIILTISLILSCSESFLDVTPLGTVTEESLQTPENADALVVAAYATLADGSLFNNVNDFIYGGIRSDDAYKGGAGPADVGFWHPLELYNIITPDNPVLGAWSGIYSRLSRCNKALETLNLITDEEMPQRKVRIAEMRFLRAHYFFVLKKLFKNIVYFDETVTIDQKKVLSNRELSNDELWDKIAEDFQSAFDNLPEEQPEVGRANKYAAAAYLAKTRLYQAYEQDENHNVTNINQTKLQEVVNMCDAVIGSGKYELFDNFGKSFTYGYDNGVESIFAVQYSINDGTPTGKLDLEHMLNYNMGPGYGCCWFNIPSQNLVNSFRTVSGLPTDDFNDIALEDSIDFWNNTVDPRLDNTVGVPTHPYKYEDGFVYQKGWARTPSVYGYFSSMKETQLPSSSSFKAIGPFFGSSKNIDIIRYDDVILMKAEALIELGRQNEALPLINQIRIRAANSDWLKYQDNSTFSNYDIQTYQDGVNCTWTQDFARNALRWERRLEFAMESPRFFDLVRWGIAAETLNAYLDEEKTKRPYLASGHFRKNQDEYLPIPQTEITLSEGIYVQNPGTW